MKHLLLKSLAIGSMALMPKVCSAQVESYPFLTWAPNKTGNVYTSAPGDSLISSSGKQVFIETATMNGHSMGGRIGFQSGLKLSASQGLLCSGKRITVSVVGLKSNDIITLIGGVTGTNTVYVRSKNASYISDGAIVSMTDQTETATNAWSSGRSYTMTGDGTFDFYIAGSDGLRIKSMTIVTPQITLGPTGYATYTNLTATDFLLPSGLTAYTVTQVTGDQATLQPSAGVIPAGMGVVLKGTAGTTYTFTQAGTNVAPPTNMMRPVSEDLILSATTGSYTNYILGEVDGQVGFVPSSGNGTIVAGKSYLQIASTMAKALRLVFDETATTGIHSMDKQIADKSAPMYNVAGQPVDSHYKGLVIVNGKKTIQR